MAFTDRHPIAHRHAARRAKQLFAAILLVALMLAVTLRALLALEALAPAVATLLFAVAAVVSGIAMLCRHDGARHIWFDIAGAMTFVGVIITVLVEPDQIIRLVTVSERPN
ncbi:MAG: hypothetical protein JWQ94_973 [Tardiphaga sp.]|nr:hypothetical protein [Tardiphaga sp.]